ncbi:MAG: tRNA pseudouridine(55) synthase TruB [Alysiella sp.]|uniref:tRNA pseudouridine(55) synthase TruB n=1 Tax=Alysiella sp. TaxID=1872483 RepID=UPI0026DCEDB8|nr:tRNA pseudouridine(55) synthase TruB [Alysiella sp.]MDO4433432.1 tRNA pseudouridine(55) synthase TruB [Alysiella sp.]
MHSTKPPKRALNGVLLLDKPIGISSNTALQQARRLFHAEKAGHTGVLDPLASGLLPICFGEATKFAQYLLDADKAYIATLKLGEASTTGDVEGEIIERGRNDITLTEFQAACASLTGKIRQVPPMFSALKHEGKPLYEYARKGITIERKAREIEIHSITIQSFSPPQAIIDVHCSKGTYIRTLSEDIATQMHTFAHLTALRRTATAGFTIEQSHTLEQLTKLPEKQRDALILPCDVLIQHLPRINLNAEQTQKLRFGQLTPVSHDFRQPEHTPLRAYDEMGNFIGLLEFIEKYRYLKALRLMNTTNKISTNPL